MPKYAFQCQACTKEFEVSLSLGSKELPECPSCNGASRKILRPPMIHFKGSGFYRTDSSTANVAPTEKPKETTPMADTGTKANTNETKPSEPSPKASNDAKKTD